MSPPTHGGLLADVAAWSVGLLFSKRRASLELLYRQLLVSAAPIAAVDAAIVLGHQKQDSFRSRGEKKTHMCKPEPTATAVPCGCVRRSISRPYHACRTGWTQLRCLLNLPPPLLAFAACSNPSPPLLEPSFSSCHTPVPVCSYELCPSITIIQLYCRPQTLFPGSVQFRPRSSSLDFLPFLANTCCLLLILRHLYTLSSPAPPRLVTDLNFDLEVAFLHRQPTLVDNQTRFLHQCVAW